MPTIKELGGSNCISIGMRFKDPDRTSVLYHEIKSNLYKHSTKAYNCIDVLTTYSDGSINSTVWYDFEVDGWQFENLILLDKEKPEMIQSTCWHRNTKKVILFTSGYLMCIDCKKDIRTLTEEEYFKAVKEYI